MRTGLVFLYYGIGGLVLGSWLQLRARLFGRDPLAAQKTLQFGYGSFVGLMKAFGIFRLRTSGMETLEGPGPRLIVSNHPSSIDSAVIVSHLPQSDNFISATWARNPLLRGFVDAVDALPSDEGPEVIQNAAARLREGRTVVMFPEGTRSPMHGLGKFQRGAAHIAMASGCDLTPIVIRMDPPTAKKGQKWYDVPDRAVDLEVRVLPPLSPGKVLDGSENPMMAARKVTAALRELYEEALGLDPETVPAEPVPGDSRS